MRKLIFLSLFVLVMTFIGISEVKAATCNPRNVVKFTHTEISGGVGYSVGGKTQSAPGRLYTAIIDGKQVQAMCLDPELAGPGSHEYCLEPMDKSDHKTADAMQYIYENGSATGSASSFATMLAARLVSYNTGFATGNGSIIGETDVGIYKTTAQLLKNGYYDDYIKTGDPSKLVGTQSALVPVGSGDTLLEALKLYQEAMKYADSGKGSSSRQVSVAKIIGADGNVSGGTGGHQRMIILGDDGKGGKGNRACKIENGKYYNGKGEETNATDFMKECCDEVNYSDLTQKEKELFDEHCTAEGSCEPLFEFPEACDATGENTKGFIKEGYDKSKRENFRACVIDKKDYIGNDYRVTIIPGVSDNRFCKVYCKEDYDYEYPGRVYGVTAGYYFRLSPATVQGTRTCITNDIDHKAFIKELHSINEQMVEAANDAIWAAKGLESNDIGEPDDITCTEEEYNSTTQQMETVTCGSKTGCDTDKHVWSAQQFKYTPSQTTIGRITSAGEKPGEYESGEAVCDGCTASCKPPIPISISEIADTYASAVETYAKLKKAREELVIQFEQCTEWQNDHKFDPLMEFEYEEGMYNDMLQKDFEKFGETSTGATEYCWKEVDDYYKCSGGSTSGGLSFIPGKDMDFTEAECTLTSSGSCTDPTDTTYKNTNAYKKSIKSTMFRSPTVWYTQIPTGEISTSGGHNKVGMVDNPEPNYSYFPVLITTEEGLHKFSFTTKDNGQYNSNNQLGRFDKIFEKYYSKVNMEYVCEYEVIGDLCTWCPPTVIDEGGGMNYFYRPISLNDVFPNSITSTNQSTKGKSGITRLRDIGANWNTAKGQATQKEIETRAGNSTLEKELTPEYSFTLSPAQMKKIRRYNHAQEKTGYGYNDFELVCNAEGLNCVSDFLKNEVVGCNYEEDCFTDLRINKTPIFVKWMNYSYIYGAPSGPAWK